MAMRYFAGNSLASFKRSSVAVTEITTAGKFDSAFVPNAIALPNGSDFFDTEDFNATGTIWLHFEYYNSTGSSTNTGPMLRNGSTGIFRIIRSGTPYFAQYWNGSSWTTTGSSFSFATSTKHRVDIKIVLNTSYELYDNGTLIASGSGWSGGPTTATNMRFNPINDAGIGAVSQVLISDTDTRNSRYMTAALNGDSATYTDGTGSFSDVNETVLNDSTAVVLTAVGNKKGFTKTSISVPTGYIIGAMCVSARGRVNGGTVTDGKLAVASGATYSASSGRSYASGYEPRGTIVENDPDTGTQFTQSGFNAAEIVVEAA
jgi:hypothetical protein